MSVIAAEYPRTQIRADRAIVLWLSLCAAMVFAMAVIGAITRLTESGLSITEWRPITGTLPPLNEAQWLREFDLYRQTPEFRLEHSWMTLADFKRIYFWEWLHRLWGRLIGLAFALPLAWFWLRGHLTDRTLRLRLLGLLALGGAQGALGWFMVMSGLVDRPSVSHYRLAAHLGLALLIYALLVAQILSLVRPRAERVPGGLRRHATLALVLLAATIAWGAFVAGLDAGLVYNTFPLMNGAWMPEELWAMAPAWLNLFENHGAVQFAHRVLALATGAAVLALAFRGLGRGIGGLPRTALMAAAVAVLLQIGLGVATLLAQVPVALGAAHQAGAILLLTALVWARWELRSSAG
ncbi:MAG TPA: COX15/CtaA family protein [Alphaproteobacteria bacterium]|nr:COX15/CtaA family protein [Alphaproteobacteria bacterium]